MNLQISLQDDCFEVSRAADWVDGVGSVPSLDECRHCLAQLQVVQEPRGHALWSAHPRVDFHLRTRRERERERCFQRRSTHKDAVSFRISSPVQVFEFWKTGILISIFLVYEIIFSLLVLVSLTTISLV